MIKLNVGGAGNLYRFEGVGFLCVDKEKNPDVQLDISKSKLPFEDSSVDAIYTSHTLEHVFPDTLDFILSEFYRVLKPEGRLRIVVPDIDLAIRAYLDNDVEFLKNHRAPSVPDVTPALPIYYLMSWWFSYTLEKNGTRLLHHLTGFNKESIEIYLKRNRFTSIIHMKCGECSPVFNGCDFEFNSVHSLHIEACK